MHTVVFVSYLFLCQGRIIRWGNESHRRSFICIASEERDESIVRARTESRFRCSKQALYRPGCWPSAFSAELTRNEGTPDMGASQWWRGQIREAGWIGLQMCLCRPHCAMTLKQPPVTNATLSSLAAGQQRSPRVRSPKGVVDGGSPVWPAYLQHTKVSSS